MKKIHRYYLIIKLFPWFKIFKYFEPKAHVVIWILPSFPNKIFDYISSSMFIKDLATINYHIKNKIKYKLIVGKSIGKVKNKKIFLSLGQYYNYLGFCNYTSNLHFIANQLEKQGNVLCPSLNEILYWENKIYMHEMFGKLKINTPNTIAIVSKKIIDDKALDFPFLIKTPHSASSAGVFNIKNYSELRKIFTDNFISQNPIVLKQELLNIRKDLRVTLVGNEIVLHYWRVNESLEWKPTSTSYGSKVDFATFPEKWRNYIIENFIKTGLTTGAFDVAWHNDDLDTEPYFLEVSPSYSPNPNTKPEKYGVTYSQFKKKLLLKDSYLEQYIKLVFSITEKHLNYILKNGK